MLWKPGVGGVLAPHHLALVSRHKPLKGMPHHGKRDSGVGEQVHPWVLVLHRENARHAPVEVLRSQLNVCQGQKMC